MISLSFQLHFCTSTVFYLFDKDHPTTHLFEYFQNRRRIGRRLSNFVSKLGVQELGDNVNEEGFLGIEESKRLYKDLGIEF